MTNENETEIWLPVRNFEGFYEVSNLGKVRGFNCGGNKRNLPKIKKSSLNKKTGYLYAILYKNKEYKPLLLSRLVLSTFTIDMPSNIDCRHLDGNKLNCTLSNLKWGTRKENEADKILHGTKPLGERNGLAKLTESIVKNIRAEVGSSTYQLATKYNISQQNVSAIRSGKTWKHVV